MPPTRVLIVDDHEMVAQGLSEVLDAEDEIDVVGRAGTVRDAERMAAQLSPDVVVMDYRLPDGDGLMATTAIREQDPDTAVVMVTASDHDTVVAAAIEAGCSGFVTKDRASADDEVVHEPQDRENGDVSPVAPATPSSPLDDPGQDAGDVPDQPASEHAPQTDPPADPDPGSPPVAPREDDPAPTPRQRPEPEPTPGQQRPTPAPEASPAPRTSAEAPVAPAPDDPSDRGGGADPQGASGGAPSADDAGGRAPAAG